MVNIHIVIPFYATNYTLVS